MKITYRYYIAGVTGDGLLKIIHRESGPYYNTDILIDGSGYKTREEALIAVRKYLESGSYCLGFTILEEMTATLKGSLNDS
jgi:hypothetical protein